ncbi:bifunctional ADP-dependent NAD(P)H-hydrate dehydratase/NAD(P)H-hydrate epimerase [soil metagenome]
MIRAYSVEAVRAAEAELMATLHEGELMLRAARGLADLVRSRAAHRQASAVAVLVGPGNNGGDGLFAAVDLAGDHQVSILYVGEEIHPDGHAAARAAHLPLIGLERSNVDLPTEALEVLDGAGIVVDALTGIGGRAGLSGAMRALVEHIDNDSYVIAVDLPSGVDPSGHRIGAGAVFADETVTFGVAKPVHLLPVTEPAVGALTVIDIGLDVPGVAAVELMEHDDVAGMWPRPGAVDHKYSRGVVGIIAGSADFPGAAVLATVAAVESGAGLVRYLGPPAATAHVVAAAPEAVPAAGRVQAWVLGPGIDAQASASGGESGDGKSEVSQADRICETMESGDACVLDAGALTFFDYPRSAPTLLTPHAGELARLLTAWPGHEEVTRAQVEAAPVAWAHAAAHVTGATVLLKGASTVIASPEQNLPIRIAASAPAWLATAGAGDVLAGLCGTLLAAGLSPRDAGSLAALVHGVAAHDANPGGPVRASTVARAIPGTVARLLSRR